VFEDRPLDIVSSQGLEGRGGGMKCPCGHGPMELKCVECFKERREG